MGGRRRLLVRCVAPSPRWQTGFLQWDDPAGPANWEHRRVAWAVVQNTEPERSLSVGPLAIRSHRCQPRRRRRRRRQAGDTGRLGCRSWALARHRAAVGTGLAACPLSNPTVVQDRDVRLDGLP